MDLHDAPVSFGMRIRALRLARGLTLEDTAKRVGVSKVTVYNWEIGRARPRPERLSGLAQAFGVSKKELEEHSQKEVPAPADMQRSGEYAAHYFGRMKREIAAFAGVEPENVVISVIY